MGRKTDTMHSYGFKQEVFVNTRLIHCIDNVLKMLVVVAQIWAQMFLTYHFQIILQLVLV